MPKDLALRTTVAVSVTGLTGAVAATRWVGGTTSGAPTTGTFLTGDFVIAQNGGLWICTAGGTPGTWAQVSGAGGGAGGETDPLVWMGGW
jgi:hypothetical protein